MDKQLEELARTYLESRYRAVKMPSMAELCNKNAEDAAARATKLGYTSAQWMAVVNAVNAKMKN